MQNLSGMVPRNMVIPTKNAIPIAYGQTITSTEQPETEEVTEVITDEGSQLDAGHCDSTDSGE